MNIRVSEEIVFYNTSTILLYLDCRWSRFWCVSSKGERIGELYVRTIALVLPRGLSEAPGRHTEIVGEGW